MGSEIFREEEIFPVVGDLSEETGEDNAMLTGTVQVEVPDAFAVEIIEVVTETETFAETREILQEGTVMETEGTLEEAMEMDL